MKTKTAQQRKNVPEGEKNLLGNIRCAQTASAFIRPGQLAWLGGAAALVGMTAAVLLSRQLIPASVDATQSHRIATAPLAVKPVQKHPVLPVAVSGQASQKIDRPESVHDALYAKEISWDARLRYVDNLGATLSPEEIRLLLDYTKQAVPDDGLKLDQRRAFKNDIIFALRNQKPAVAELTGVLVGIYRDKAQDPGMRDYAIQHLSEWRWKIMQSDPSAVREIDDTLWAAAGETNQPLSGTALLALHRLVNDTKMPDHDGYASAYQERLTRAASAIAADEKAPLAARITAVGISGQTPTAETTALITGILSQPQAQPPTLQLAALGALVKNLPGGTPLESQTRALLENAARSAYPPVQKLAATTLRNHTL